MTKKDRLMARCDDLAFRNQCVPSLAKEASKVRRLCVEDQSLNYEQQESATIGSSERGRSG